MTPLLLLLALARATPGSAPDGSVEPSEPSEQPQADPAIEEGEPPLPDTAVEPEPAAPQPSTPAGIEPIPVAPEPAGIEPTSAAPEPASPAPPAEALSRAKRLYFEGEHGAAQRELEVLRDRLEASEDTTGEVYEQTMLYLGEVQFLLGDRAGAWRTFESLLEVRPDATMSTFNHPREVVHWFELVRQRVAQERPDPVPVGPPPSLPVWGYAPFGVPQFRLGQPRRGVTHSVLQATFLGISVGTMVHLAVINRQDHPTEWTQEELARRVNIERYAIQWPATAAFYGLWLASHLDARRTWRLERAQPVQIGVTLGGRRLGLVVHGRF